MFLCFLNFSTPHTHSALHLVPPSGSVASPVDRFAGLIHFYVEYVSKLFGNCFLNTKYDRKNNEQRFGTEITILIFGDFSIF